MFNYKHYRFVCYFVRHHATKTKVIPDENVINNIDKQLYKPRNHPGILKPRVITVPESFVNAVKNVLEDYPVKSIIEDGKVLSSHLKGKRPPVEKEELRKTIQDVKERVVSHFKNPQVETEQDRLRFEQAVKDRTTNILYKEVYNWKPVNYTTYNALVYLLARSAAEYAVLVKIFSEIAERDPEFKPRSLFDFGSGVGTVTWASTLFWKKCIFEYFNVDASVEMNELAQILLQNGKGTDKMTLRGVFYRQFLPASNTTYDLVVSAYSLMELPSRQTRLETVLNLWNKTQKYLIIVEQGTYAGFQVINEIRDFILQTKKDKNLGHVFSPCPNDKTCPRFLLNDNTPCNFQIHYFSMPVGANSGRKSERYSYVVLKKGKRDPSDQQWPRVVRETLVRSKHTICRMCTKNGELEEVIFTSAKHGKTIYHCARSTRWGDLLPVTLEKPSVKDDVNNCNDSENHKEE